MTSNFDARMVQQMYANFDRLLQEQHLVDCHLIARPDPPNNGAFKHAFVKAHRLVLSAVSNFFDKAIRDQSANPIAIIDLSQYEQSTVEHLVSYIYKGAIQNNADRLKLKMLALHVEMLSLYEQCTAQSSPETAVTPPQQMEIEVLPEAQAQPSAFIGLKRRATTDQSPTSQFDELMKRVKLDNGSENSHLKALLHSEKPTAYSNLSIDTLGNHADSRFVAPHIQQTPQQHDREELPPNYPIVPEVNFELQQQIDPTPARSHLQNFLMNRFALADLASAIQNQNTQSALQQALQGQQPSREQTLQTLLARRNLIGPDLLKRLQELAQTQQAQNGTQQQAPEVKQPKEEPKEVESAKAAKPSEDKDEGWCRNKKYIEKVDNGFMCTVCNKVYGRYNSVSYHVTIYHRNPPIHCEIDGCQFTTREARYIHFHKYYRHGISLPKTIDLSSRSCPFCRHIAKSPAMLEKHVKRHVGDNAAQVCSGLKAVVKTTETDEDGPHNCDVCSASFASKNALYEHTATAHERPITYDCHLCSRRAMPGHVYQSHMALAHQQTVSLANSTPTPAAGTSSSTITAEQVNEVARQLQAQRRSTQQEMGGLQHGVDILAAVSRKGGVAHKQAASETEH